MVENSDSDESKPSEQFSLRHELQRKAIHLAMGIVPIWVWLVPPRTAMLGLILATSVTVIVDLLRLSDRRLRSFFLSLFRSLIRRHEEKHLLGSTHYMLAALLSVLVFDKMIAVAALAFLVLGDTVAAIFGKRFGTIAFWGKSLAGSSACLVTCLLLGGIILRDPVLAVAGAVAATIAEALPLPMDDNMRVPIISGLVMQLVAHYILG